MGACVASLVAWKENVISLNSKTLTNPTNAIHPCPGSVQHQKISECAPSGRSSVGRAYASIAPVNPSHSIEIIRLRLASLCSPWLRTSRPLGFRCERPFEAPRPRHHVTPALEPFTARPNFRVRGIGFHGITRAASSTFQNARLEAGCGAFQSSTPWSEQRCG